MSDSNLNALLRVNLYNNGFKNGDGTLTGRVESEGIMRNEDIAQVIVNERTEYRLETIINIMSMADKIKQRGLANGKHIIDGLGMHYLTTRGVYTGESAQFDASINSIKVAFKPSKDLMTLIKAAEVATKGAKMVGPVINSITDSTTGVINEELTSGGPAIIEGRNIKVVGDDPTVGIYFTAEEENAVPVKVNLLVENNPSKVIIILPVLDSSKQYTLDIVTQYSNGSTILKTPRSYHFPILLGKDIPDEPEEDEPVVQ